MPRGNPIWALKMKAEITGGIWLPGAASCGQSAKRDIFIPPPLGTQPNQPCTPSRESASQAAPLACGILKGGSGVKYLTSLIP